MAVIDYGAIAFKNGKCIQGDYFGDMLSLVGWENEELKGSYFSYVGDKDFTVCFYKTSVYVYYDGELERISLNDRFIGWKKYRGLYVTGNYTDIIEFEIKPRQRDCYTFTMEYKGDKYKVVFGYGIDYPYYMKTGIYNYYCSPEHFFKHSLPRLFKYFPDEVRIRIEIWRRKHDRKEQEKRGEQETP